MKLAQDYRRESVIVDAFGGMDTLKEIGQMAAEAPAASCPFCGGEPVVALGRVYGAPSVRVECGKCHVSTLWRGGDWDYFEARQLTLADAVRRSAQNWNRREAAK